jgi:hypothetical protein
MMYSASFLLTSLSEAVSDREVSPLLPSEVSLNESAVGAAKIIERVRQILADVNLPVRVRDFVDDRHGLGSLLVIPILPRSSPSQPS